jgi:hypothetical protein
MDELEDKELQIWSGIIPLELVMGDPITAPDSQGIALPSHIA